VKHIIAFAVIFCQAAAVLAGEWQVDREARDNQVKFTSRVASFSFEGVTGKVDGYIYWEGQGLFEKNTQLQFEVELNSLDTGIGKRNRDMYQVLRTDQWPKAVFKGQITEWAPIDSTVAAYRGKVKGTLSLHGVEREMEAAGVIAADGDRYRLTSDFALQLKDFDIEAPSLVAFIKVSQEIAVAVSCYLKPVPRQE
jgi:polyisoprenoid-binding protein YceI